MIARKCDRCGILYESYGGIAIKNGYNITTNSIRFENDNDKVCSNRYDLCPDCMRTIVKWFEDGEQEKENGKTEDNR